MQTKIPRVRTIIKKFISTVALLRGLVLSYIKMTNLSIMASDSLEKADGALVSSINALVTSGKLFHVFQAVFFPRPAKKGVVSHPLRLGTQEDTQI